MRLRFLWVGKTKNSFIRGLAADYLERIRHMVPCEVIETRDLSRKRSLKAAALLDGEAEEFVRHLPPSGIIVALDENGTQLSSVGFSQWLVSELNSGHRSISFVIGGAEGMSPKITERAHLVLSIGKMTWTHEMCRALLLEQVYRALSILRGIPYHKA
ncbi:MAG: 23S rRNA (pseudouridine(1915)-N(3))-methyltransferase RlmH [Acidobacteria bacterium]|nr:23S rRNA (pseudouridine(1915)-N(3))-methyltransferase RlmH [Acidobacteriota bacterium]